ncbi:hypothetical protein N9061_00145 [bacterium]|nr:hypothetical protein [bacterium]
MIWGRFYGASIQIECYMVAVGIQATAMQFLQSGRAANILIPAYHEAKQNHNAAAARDIFSVIINWSILFSVSMIALGISTAHFLIPLRAAGFDDASIQLTIAIYCFSLPTILLSYLTALISAYLNAEMKFGTPELATVLAQVSGLLTTLTLFHWLGIWALVAAMWVTSSVGIIFVGTAMLKLGYRHRILWSKNGFSVVNFYRYLFATLLYAGSTEIYKFIFDSALSALPQGSLAIFKYSQRVFVKLSSLLLRPVSIVYFSIFSEAASQKSHDQKPALASAIQLVLSVAIPPAIIFIFISFDLFTLILGSKGFSPKELLEAATVFIGFLAIIPLLGFNQIYRKYTVARGHLYLIDFGSIVCQLLSAWLASFLISEYGLAGGVLTFLANVVLNLILAILILRFTSRDESHDFPTWVFIRWSALLGLATISGLSLNYWFAKMPYDSLIWTTAWRLPLVCTCSAALFYGLAKLLRIPDSDYWLRSAPKAVAKVKQLLAFGK